MTVFGSNLKKVRKGRGMTQGEMAEKLDISVRAYQSYERGERDPSANMLMSIITILNVPINTLISSVGFGDDQMLYDAAAQLIRVLKSGGASGPAKDAVMIAIQNEYWIAKKSTRSQKINRCLVELQNIINENGRIITETGEEVDDEDE